MSIHLITGCMYSGKSTKLLKIIDDNPLISTLLINFELDNRYSDDPIVETHSGQTKEALMCGENIMKVIINDKYKECKIICVDEAQFFKNLRDFVFLHVQKEKMYMLRD